MGLKFTEIIETRWSQGPAQKVEGDGEFKGGRVRHRWVEWGRPYTFRSARVHGPEKGRRR